MKNIKHTYEKITGIYCILNLSNSKIYIGSSNHIYYRLRGHLHKLRESKHHTQHLQNSFNKNGEDTFYSFVVERCAEEYLIEREEYWMNLLKADYNKVFKDLQRPACSYSQETRDKISASVKKQHDEGLLSCGRVEVYVYDLNGKFVKTFNSYKTCIEELNTSKSSIDRVVKGIHKQANGYQFSLSLLENMPPVIHEVKIKTPRRNYSILMTNINTEEVTEFKNFKECADNFNVKYNTIHKIIEKDVLYKKVYKFTVATKLGELSGKP